MRKGNRKPMRRATWLLLTAGSLAYASANANSVSYSGTDDGNSVSGSTTMIGNLTEPSNIVFTDVLSSNVSSSPLTSVDNWSFSIPSSVVGSSVTGEQIWLSNFQVSGVVDNFALYSGAVGSGTLVTNGTQTGDFSSYMLGNLAAGSYYLRIQATLSPGSASAPTVGSYTGTLVAAPVPLPATLPLLISGIAAGFLLFRRRPNALDGIAERGCFAAH